MFVVWGKEVGTFVLIWARGDACRLHKITWMNILMFFGLGLVDHAIKQFGLYILILEGTPDRRTLHRFIDPQI